MESTNSEPNRCPRIWNWRKFHAKLNGGLKLIHSGWKIHFLTKNINKHEIPTDICKKNSKKMFFLKSNVFQDHWESIWASNWIRRKISDFLRPLNSHLGQNWRFPYQIPLQTTNSFSPENFLLCVIFRVSVQGVKSLGSHFACLCRGFEFYEVKKKEFCYYFSKRKWKYFYTFYHFYSEKSSKRAK